MRCVFRFWFAFALGLALMSGCSDENGEGGSGGTGGMPECQSPEDCNDANDCTADACADGVCEFTAVEDQTDCTVLGELFSAPGLCVTGSCVLECEVLGEGSACRLPTEGTGVCIDIFCEPRCENDTDCTDYKDCTADTCLSNGLCESIAVQNGTPCEGGTCQSGECNLETSLLPCNEQGIRNATAAGGGPYMFDCGGPKTVAIQTTIAIDKNVSLDGAGDLTIKGNDDESVVSVARGVTAELDGLVVTGGFSPASGSIENLGTLTLTNCSVSENAGTGIDNEGTLTLMNSTVSDNGRSFPQYAIGVGGIDSHGDRASLTLMNSAVLDNAGYVGGISAGGVLSAVNTTISGNSGDRVGGIRVSGTVTLVSSTVSGNETGERSDIFGLDTAGDSLTVANTIIDGDCSTFRSIVSLGYNIESPDQTCGFDQTSDQPGVTAEQLNLGPLADNGGPTMTHALQTVPVVSVAIDHIPAGDCVDADGQPLTTDQRGEPRPETGGTLCDVGAFEVQP